MKYIQFEKKLASAKLLGAWLNSSVCFLPITISQCRGGPSAIASKQLRWELNKASHPTLSNLGHLIARTNSLKVFLVVQVARNKMPPTADKIFWHDLSKPPKSTLKWGLKKVTAIFSHLLVRLWLSLARKSWFSWQPYIKSFECDAWHASLHPVLCCRAVWTYCAQDSLEIFAKTFYF